ncbi:hypothetical protein WN943_006981 [Citrus x changshan-huyou]
MCPRNEAERKEMSRVPYASAVGSLMFVMICTRPDIVQAVGVISRYMANLGGECWIAVKRILRYIRGTSNVALCYGGSEFTVRGYVDSKLPTIVALSTTEVEYMTTPKAYKEGIWIQRLLEELGHKQQKILVFCDSQSALHIVRNLAFHFRTKHIWVQYHFVREVVEGGSRRKQHDKGEAERMMWRLISSQSNLQVGECQKGERWGTAQCPTAKAKRKKKKKKEKEEKEGPCIVRQSVGNTPCLLGKAVDCYYIRGPKYLEIDVDIGSSTVANGVLGLVIGVITTLVVDMAFLVQTNTIDELPERLIGAVRVSHIELKSAIVPKLEPETP